MELKQIIEKYDYNFSDFYTNLWNDGMLDWFKDWNEPWTKERNWFTEVYPKIKDNPPILLHSGGDFNMLKPKDILEYEFYDWWDKKHKFIPFAETGAGDLFAFYDNMTIDGENVVVLVWHDSNRTEILAKNFEDFIFRKMVESVTEESWYEEKFEDPEFKENLLADLKTAKKYLNESYVKILNEIFNRSFSGTIVTKDEKEEIFKTTIYFENIDTEFKHEKD